MIKTLELVPLWQTENYVKTQSIMCRSCVDHVSIMCRSRVDHASIQPHMESVYYIHTVAAQAVCNIVHEPRTRAVHKARTTQTRVRRSRCADG